MASINKVIVLGNLGADPEVRYTPDGGTAIATLRIATSRRYKTATVSPWKKPNGTASFFSAALLNSPRTICARAAPS